jgi:hypothetical protein
MTVGGSDLFFLACFDYAFPDQRPAISIAIGTLYIDPHCVLQRRGDPARIVFRMQGGRKYEGLN